MFKLTFYAVRHGQTRWNAEGRFQGLTDIPLSAEGRERVSVNALRLAALFAGRTAEAVPRRILVSPLARALETAEALRRALDLPATAVAVDPRLAEAGYGAWEGWTTLDVKARFPEQRRQRRNDRWFFAPPGGDSHEDLRVRMGGLLEDLQRDSPRLEHEPPPLLVTHTGNLRVLMVLAGGVERDEAVRAPISQDALFFFAGGTVSIL